MRVVGLSLLLALAMLTGCSSQPYKDGYPAQDNWVVLPIQSLEVGEYNTQIERMLKVLLAQRGVQNVVLPPESDIQGNNTALQCPSPEERRGMGKAAQRPVRHTVMTTPIPITAASRSA